VRINASATRPARGHSAELEVTVQIDPRETMF
jgi:hypothetical protein